MVKGIYITNPIGRTGNHIITALNGIYLCKKYKLRWIIFDNNFKSFNSIGFFDICFTPNFLLMPIKFSDMIGCFISI